MDRAVVGLCVLVYLQLTLQAGRSTSLINRCYALCDHEVQARAACIEERNCRMLILDLNEFYECTQPCNYLGNKCFQRCALGTDHINSQCHDLCGGSDSCFDDCYTHLLNQRINTVYQKKKPRRMDRDIA